MKTSAITGVIGLLLSLTLGRFYLNFSPFDIFFFVLSANIACFVSLLGVLQIDQLSFSIKKWLSGTFKAWSILIALYLGILLGLCPALRDTQALAYLILPLIFSSGFSLLAFGPIRDRIVWGRQKKTFCQSSPSASSRLSSAMDSSS